MANSTLRYCAFKIISFWSSSCQALLIAITLFYLRQNCTLKWLKITMDKNKYPIFRLFVETRVAEPKLFCFASGFTFSTVFDSSGIRLRFRPETRVYCFCLTHIYVKYRYRTWSYMIQMAFLKL